MKKEYIYIAVAVFLALFLVAVSFKDPANIIGRVIDENATNQTSDNQTTTTNQTTETNQTSDNQTTTTNQTETINQTTETNQTSDNQTTTTNQTETINQTTETSETINQTDTTSQADTTTQDDSSQTTTTTDEEEESTVQVPVNATGSSVDSGSVAAAESSESEVDRIIRELEEQGLLEGSQPEQQQEEEAPTLTGSAIGESNETTCEGCLLKLECYAFNERKKGDYCLENKSWSPQIAFNEICTENFECRSNSCVSGQCTQVNILQLIIDWIRELFNIGSSGSSNITNSSN